MHCVYTVTHLFVGEKAVKRSLFQDNMSITQLSLNV